MMFPPAALLTRPLLRVMSATALAAACLVSCPIAATGVGGPGHAVSDRHGGQRLGRTLHRDHSSRLETDRLDNGPRNALAYRVPTSVRNLVCDAASAFTQSS